MDQGLGSPGPIRVSSPTSARCLSAAGPDGGTPLSFSARLFESAIEARREPRLRCPRQWTVGRPGLMVLYRELLVEDQHLGYIACLQIKKSAWPLIEGRALLQLGKHNSAQGESMASSQKLQRRTKNQPPTSTPGKYPSLISLISTVGGPAVLQLVHQAAASARFTRPRRRVCRCQPLWPWLMLPKTSPGWWRA